MKQPVIGFIGFGEAASGITKGLKESGLEIVNFFDIYWNKEPYGRLINNRAQETGAVLKKNVQDLVDASDIIISCVTASVVVEVAKSAVPFLKKRHLYVDVNASSPMTKEEAAKIIEKTGANYIDAAVMGPIPSYLHRVPILASGSGAESFKEIMEKFGMNIACIGEKPGRASAIKMFRSVFMKGYVALLIETLHACHKYDVMDLVVDSINETLNKNSFIDGVQLLVPRGVIHAERRAHEMKEVIKTLESIGVPSTMSEATLKKLEWCSSLKLKEYFKGEPPQTLNEVVNAIEEKMKTINGYYS